MAKLVYDATVVRAFNAGPCIDWAGWTIKCGLVSTAYTVSAAHADFTSISAFLIDEALVSSKSQSGRSIFGSIASFTGLANGPIVESVVFFRETGTPATEFLLWYDDTLPLFPFQTVGTPIALTYPSNKLLEFPV